MTISKSAAGAIELNGDCPIEDAQVLQERLLEAPEAAIDWRNCEQAHTAVIQVIMACKRTLIGMPKSRFLQERVAPLMPRAP